MSSRDNEPSNPTTATTTAATPANKQLRHYSAGLNSLQSLESPDRGFSQQERSERLQQQQQQQQQRQRQQQQAETLLTKRPASLAPKSRGISIGIQNVSLPTMVNTRNNSHSNFQDAVERHDAEGGGASSLDGGNMTDNSLRRSTLRQAYSSTAMGERPLGFRLVSQAKKMSRRVAREGNGSVNNSFVGKILGSSQRGESDMTHEGSRLIPAAESSEDASDEGGGGSPPSCCATLMDIIFGKYVSIFLILVPFAFLAKYLEWSDLYIFWINFFIMIPLAAILGDFTEEVAAHTNEVVGGLINATFGNAVEVVVAVQALIANEIRVVQASMIGSIFSNLLLVLGCCFFFGGLKYKEQSFNPTAATANMSLLALSSIALVLPTPFASYYEVQDERVLIVSRTAAIFLMSMYIQLLIFQLKTHAYLFNGDDDEQPGMSMRAAMLGLCVTTLLITFFSDMLVESIDGFVTESGISRTFVGLIILPIVGNAVEHMTAVTVAMKDKMDLAMGVAVGSSTQISLFVVPFTVLTGWALDRNMTLNFPHFEIILYAFSVVIVSICLSNPRGNWLEGSLLITTYIMVAVGFFYEDVKDF